MPCYPMVQKRAARLGIKLPEPAKKEDEKQKQDQEVRAAFGAVDHEHMHELVDHMGDAEFLEKVKKLREKLRRKRQEAAEAYIAQEAHY